MTTVSNPSRLVAELAGHKDSWLIARFSVSDPDDTRQED